MIQFQLANPLINAWIKFGQTKDILERAVDKTFSGTPLTAEQYKVLAVIINHPGPVIQRDIGRWLYRKPNSISALLSQMEKSGLVELSRSTKDKRVVYVNATGEGVALYWEVSPVVWDLVSKSVGAFDRQELQCFTQALDKFRATIGEILEDGHFVTETVEVDDQAQLDELRRRANEGGGNGPAPNEWATPNRY